MLSAVKYFSNIKISSKITISYALIIVILAGYSIFTLSNMHTLSEDFQNYKELSQEALLMGKMTEHMSEISVNALRYRERNDIEYALVVEKNLKDLSVLKQSILQLITNPDDQDKLIKLEKKIESYGNDFLEFKNSKKAIFPTVEESSEDASLEKREKEIFNEYKYLIANVRDRQNSTSKEADTIIKNASVYTIYVSVAVGILCTTVSFAMSGFLSKSFKLIIDETQNVVEGKSNLERTNRNDEVGLILETLVKAKDRISSAIYQAQMIEEIPTGVMLADAKDDFKITYMNPEVKNILRAVEDHVPVKVDDMIGTSIDRFHKKPEHQRSILSNPGNLPVTTRLEIGGRYMDLKVTAIRSGAGDYIGPMVTWKDVTTLVNLADEFEDSVGSVVQSVGKAADEMNEMASILSAAIQESTAQSGAVAAASIQASTNVQTVAAASEELTASIREISKNVVDTADTARDCAKSAETSQNNLQNLQNAVEEIGTVVQSINEVAEQTNLLALNATIEAARAGEAGKGFAVVASEVKALASETHKMTDEIANIVSDIRSSANDTITSVSDILVKIRSVDGKTATVSAAVEEQNSSTEEISRNVQEAARGTDEVSRNIGEVQQAANDSSQATEQLKVASSDLIQEAENLDEAVKAFLIEVRAS
jgi:methyl-accepting chemotaxis protein